MRSIFTSPLFMAMISPASSAILKKLAGLHAHSRVRGRLGVSRRWFMSTGLRRL
jgi:hypothetical protein